LDFYLYYMKKSEHKKFLNLGDYLLTDEYDHKYELLDYITKYDKNVCWIFGDSFMDFYYGYIRHYLEKYNKKAVILARGGTGVEYSYLKFKEVEELIKPYHTVLAGISASARSYFNGFHVNSNLKINTPTRHWLNPPVEPTQRFKQAVELYYLELLNLEDREVIFEGLVENFYQRIINRTKKAVIIPTVHTYKALDNQPSIMNVLDKWMVEGNIPATHNHWLEDKEFEDTFYKHYDNIFEIWG